MKELFKLDDEYNVILEPWVLLVPEFNKIVKLDKGSPGDYRGDLKLKAKKQLAFIYLMCDFRSKIYDWDPSEKELEAFRYTGLKLADTQLPEVKEAYDYYIDFQHKCARSLKTLEVLNKGLAKLDQYFEDIDFTLKDKQGKLLNSTKEFMANMSGVDDAYKAVENFEKRVTEQLKADDTGIRGKNSSLGGKEGTRKSWNETGNPKPSKVKMVDLDSLISGVTNRFSNSIDDEIMEPGDEPEEGVDDGVS